MDTIKKCWEQFCDPANIREAILNAAKGKLDYREVREILSNIDTYSEKLSHALLDGSWRPAPYKTRRIKTEYGKERDIFMLPFYGDRIVQHDIALVMRDRWVKSLTLDAYACIPGRGIHCRTKRYSMVTKIKRAVQSYRGRRVFVLVLDISKCYPNVDNVIMAQIYRRTLADPQLLKIVDAINGMCEGLPIGNFLSQMLINLYLNPLDRFVKEELKARHYFRYMDNLAILSEDKEQLHQWKWRIANFLWYVLKMELNSMRQVFPLGRTLAERGLDLGGVVFRQSPTDGRCATRLRKRIKQAYARKLGKPKSEAAYLGQMQGLDCKHLIRSLNEKKSLKRKVTTTTEMPNLSDVLGTRIERPFEGDNIKIEQIIDKEIELLNWDVRPSDKKPNTLYCKMQIRYEGRKRFVGGGYQFICQVLQQLPKPKPGDEPIKTIIRNKRGYYFDGTINEE